MDLDTFRRYTEWHDHVNQRSYEAPADPWKLVSVGPAEIEHCAPGIGLYGLGRVEGGDWDQDPRTVADLFVYEGLVQRFDEGRDWEETRYVEWAREQFESGERPRYYEDLNAFLDRRCEYVDDLYERIAREGYRPNAEAGHDNPAAEDNPFEDAYVHRFEPLVAIGRSGALLLTEGFHRVCLSAIQGIDEIPVQVVCRHRDWQRIRDRLATTEHLPERLARHRGHPDLADVTEPNR